MKILNFGSLNIDHVYRVEHLVAAGETISSKSLQTFAGGKGANQSVALARAGAAVSHAGRVGKDGRWLIEKLAACGVDTRFIRTGDGPTGHAIIEVNDDGENSIILFPGENRRIERSDIAEILPNFERGDLILIQNEINDVACIMETARACGLRICFNPAPFDKGVLNYPLNLVDILILNETEAAGMTGFIESDDILSYMAVKYPDCRVILTLGKRGAVYRFAKKEVRVPALKVKAVDTTAAGDTFIGYYLASLAAGKREKTCLAAGCAAAAVCVTRPGAMDSIPSASEVRV